MSAYIVDTAAIRQNIALIRKKAGTATVFAVVKGDGYGLGTEKLARLLSEEGIDHFAVTEPKEAGILRQMGEKNVLMLRATDDPGEISTLLELDAILTIGSLSDAVAISGIAREKGKKARVHLKVDTGMGRYGFLPSEQDKLLACYEYLDTLDICGIYTHFHSAFCNKKATRRQFAQLQAMVDAVRAAGFDPGMVHCANSSALFRCPETAMDAVRVGSAILGRLSFRTGLKKVGFCETHVTQVKWLPKGHTCGYGAAFRTKKPTQIAVLPVGWFHGFATEYGNDVFRFRDCLRKVLSGLKAMVFRPSVTVKVGNTVCKTLGHVGMLHTVVDVTGKNINPGETAIFEINPLRVRGMEIKYV